jgi:hypothetical protein
MKMKKNHKNAKTFELPKILKNSLKCTIICKNGKIGKNYKNSKNLKKFGKIWKNSKKLI